MRKYDLNLLICSNYCWNYGFRIHIFTLNFDRNIFVVLILKYGLFLFFYFSAAIKYVTEIRRNFIAAPFQFLSSKSSM
jgi:hypothetical protein